MAAANESQGLKIAVAAFVTLSVILAVTSYFAYSAYTKSEAVAESEKENAKKSDARASLAVNQYNEFRQLAGARAEEVDAAKAEIAAFFKKNSDRVSSLAAQTTASIQKAKQAGVDSKDIDDALARVQSIISSYQAEPNKNFMSTLDRLTELMENVNLLGNEMSSNYVGLRKSLESTTSVAKKQIDVEAKAASDSKADLEAEHNKHESERQTLLTKVDQLQTANNDAMTKIANLETQIKQQSEDAARKLELANSIMREQRDRLDKTDVVLDKPGGYISYVDLDRREVHVNITRRMGARPQMKMTVFDAGSPGVPTETPKGNIQLTHVGDQYSVARIDRVNSSINPFRIGDIVYSPAWSPDEPMRFALIGKMDVNRDGKDDRQDLKRMIEEAGGVVDYDLPPPGYGSESGKLTARDAWYVIDERPPLRERFEAKSDRAIAEQAKFDAKKGQVIKQARAEGIRPMPIQRLLAFLGYEMGTPAVGRAEAVNDQALRRLIEPRKRAEAPKSAADQPKTEPDAAAPPADEPKKDEAKDEPKADAEDKPQ
jgi:hypothetical protein